LADWWEKHYVGLPEHEDLTLYQQPCKKKKKEEKKKL